MDGFDTKIGLGGLSVSLVCHASLDGDVCWWILRESDAAAHEADDLHVLEMRTCTGVTQAPAKGYIVVMLDGISLAPFRQVVFAKWSKKILDIAVDCIWPLFALAVRSTDALLVKEWIAWVQVVSDIFWVLADGGLSSGGRCLCGARDVCQECKGLNAEERLFLLEDDCYGAHQLGESRWWSGISDCGFDGEEEIMRRSSGGCALKVEPQP
jgi:hypothetical protein